MGRRATLRQRSTQEYNHKSQILRRQLGKMSTLQKQTELLTLLQKLYIEKYLFIYKLPIELTRTLVVGIVNGRPSPTALIRAVRVKRRCDPLFTIFPLLLALGGIIYSGIIGLLHSHYHSATLINIVIILVIFFCSTFVAVTYYLLFISHLQDLIHGFNQLITYTFGLERCFYSNTKQQSNAQASDTIAQVLRGWMWGGVILPPLTVPIVLYYEIDQLTLLVATIFQILPFLQDFFMIIVLNSKLLFNIGFYIVRFILCLLFVQEVTRVMMFAVVGCLLLAKMLLNSILFNDLIFRRVILTRRQTKWQHIHLYRQLTIIVHIGCGAISSFAFFGLVSVFLGCLVANLGTVKVHSMVPLILYIWGPYFSITLSFIMLSGLSLGGSFRENSNELLRKFRLQSTTRMDKKCAQKEMATLETLGIPVGVTGYKFFVIKRTTTSTVLNILLDQTISLLLYF